MLKLNKDVEEDQAMVQRDTTMTQGKNAAKQGAKGPVILYKHHL